MTARRWIATLGAVLVVSLAFNIFFGGVIVGHRFGRAGGFEWQMTPAKLKLGLERVLHALPDSDAKVVRGLFEARAAEIAQRFRAFQDSRNAIGAALRADPFDSAAFTAAYETMQARSQDLQAAIHPVIKPPIPHPPPHLPP